MGNRTREGKMKSTKGFQQLAPCGMITPRELSRIQNLHEHMSLSFGLWSRTVRMYKISENYVQGEEKISGEKTFQVSSINMKH
jgi:hypothetical protein